MTLEHAIYAIVAVVGGAGLVLAMFGLVRAIGFRRHVLRELAIEPGHRHADGTFRYQPRAAVFLPCKGVDDKLHHTVEQLCSLNYRDYEVIFCVESENDAAHAAIGEWTRSWNRPHHIVVAGQATQRGQKIHNLLAGLAAASANREVFVFLDSDAVPDADWLGHLVAPLQRESIGAATGYRWYTATGGLAAGVRCTWNAAPTSTLHDDRVNFCWGGSTAILAERFRQLDVAGRWDRALSDDLQLTRAIKAAGLSIHFVPQALVSSADATTLRGFWEFARRQYIILRICTPASWLSGFLYCSVLVAGGTAVAGLAVCGLAGWFGSPEAACMALAAWAGIMGLAGALALVRQSALRRVLRPPHYSWRDVAWDVLGTVTFSGSMHLHLFIASMFRRRIVWRGIEYDMVSADETRVLRRS